MNELKLYFVLFAIHHNNKEWGASAGYVFARDQHNLENILNRQYGRVNIRSAQEIDISEGLILYGERWHTVWS